MPDGMSGQPSVDRFKREISIAARSDSRYIDLKRRVLATAFKS